MADERVQIGPEQPGRLLSCRGAALWGLAVVYKKCNKPGYLQGYLQIAVNPESDNWWCGAETVGHGQSSGVEVYRCGVLNG